MTAGEVFADVRALCASSRATLALSAGALTAADLTASTVGQLRGQVAAARVEAARLLAALAATDYSDAASPSEGEGVFAALRWQTSTTVGLLRLEGGLRAADDALRQIDAAPELRQVIARQGDTLQTLAARELGDFRRWPEIAAVNGLAAGAAPTGALWVPT